MRNFCLTNEEVLGMFLLPFYCEVLDNNTCALSITLNILDESLGTDSGFRMTEPLSSSANLKEAEESRSSLVLMIYGPSPGNDDS